MNTVNVNIGIQRLGTGFERIGTSCGHFARTRPLITAAGIMLVTYAVARNRFSVCRSAYNDFRNLPLSVQVGVVLSVTIIVSGVALVILTARKQRLSVEVPSISVRIPNPDEVPVVRPPVEMTPLLDPVLVEQECAEKEKAQDAIEKGQREQEEIEERQREREKEILPTKEPIKETIIILDPIDIIPAIQEPVAAREPVTAQEQEPAPIKEKPAKAKKQPVMKKSPPLKFLDEAQKNR